MFSSDILAVLYATNSVAHDGYQRTQSSNNYARNVEPNLFRIVCWIGIGILQRSRSSTRVHLSLRQFSAAPAA